LEEKLRDLEIEKAETTASIEASQRTLHIQKNSTQAEALRLKGNAPFEAKGPWCNLLTWHSCADELASLEQLHLWHTSRVHADLFEFVYASRFHVHIPCSKFKPLKNQIRITKTKGMLLKLKDQFHRFTDLTIKLAEQRLASSSSVKQVSSRFAVTRTLADSLSVRRLFRAWAIFGWDVHNCAHTSRSYPSNILCR
jgi:kinetochore protein Spc7/SPC105